MNYASIITHTQRNIPFPAGVKWCPSCPKGPDLLWGLCSLLFIGQPRARYAEVKWPVREADHSPSSNAHTPGQAVWECSYLRTYAAPDKYFIHSPYQFLPRVVSAPSQLFPQVVTFSHLKFTALPVNFMTTNFLLSLLQFCLLPPFTYGPYVTAHNIATSPKKWNSQYRPCLE